MTWMQNSILHPNHILFALGTCILKPFRPILWFILASVHMVMVCVCTLFISGHESATSGGAACGQSVLLIVWMVHIVESADTHHDHVHRGQDKSKNGPETASECTSRGRIIHDMNARSNSTYISFIICPREVHSEAVSVHFMIYLGLGAYGHGLCLHSLHFGPRVGY